MFDSPSIIAGLEIGTSKVCAVVGEENESGALTIIGLGQAPSRGVRKGEIVDFELAAEDIRTAVAEAEQMADVEIRRVYLGVTGSHLRGLNNRGYHPVASVDREITADDVQDVMRNAKAVSLPPDHSVVHTVRQHFLVDGQGGIQNPVGMLGARVEVDVHVIHGVRNRLQNALRTVKGLQIEVEEVCFNGLASAMAVLNSEHKELGALVIDLGAGATEYVVHANGIVKHSGVIAVGGDHISNDLALGLKVSLGRAEQLKIEHGNAIHDDGVRGQTLTLNSPSGLIEKTINLEHLRRIMAARVEETFELIAQALEKEGFSDCLRAGVFLCGGGAHIPRIKELAGEIFDLPVSLATAGSLSGTTAALDQPEFCTGIGLVKFGSMQARGRTRGGRGFFNLRGALGSWLGRR
ncbi:MAG: cell division protein FtsA [Verrucomicrobia bacterium]|nr:cell division protein FtsA [Verrucomicrobiota bacterium]